MFNLNKKNLKLAIQKNGRLTGETLDFLRKSGLMFESGNLRLFSSCRNFPLEIIYIRDDDILEFVEKGTVELGIVGQNLLYEQRAVVKKLLNLRYGFCSLVIAVPKESKIQYIRELAGKKIATAYPISAEKYFKKLDIPIELMQISGSLEIAPALGVANAIIDLASTGSTIMLNDLKILTKIYDSEAVLISNAKVMESEKKRLIEKLITRFKGVLSADNYKYIIMNVPRKSTREIRKIIPGLKSSAISPFINDSWITLSSVVKEDVFWETIEKLKKYGAFGILILPVEKMIT